MHLSVSYGEGTNFDVAQKDYELSQLFDEMGLTYHSDEKSRMIVAQKPRERARRDNRLGKNIPR